MLTICLSLIRRSISIIVTGLFLMLVITSELALGTGPPGAEGPVPGMLKSVAIILNGDSNVQIIIPSNPSEFEIIAAKDLSTYLTKVTNTSIEIKTENEEKEKTPIYIGRCQASQHLSSTLDRLINDGYVIEINMDSIHLLGKNDLATRFAVYGFLEDYIDVHWFLPEVFGEGFPANMGTYIPQKETIILPPTLDIQVPSFKYRKIGNPDDPWTIQNKMNFISEANHGFQINKMAHSFGDFVDPKKYYNFPAYFAMVDRKLMDPEEIKTTPCELIKLNVSNPEVRDVMVNEVVNYIDSHPEIEIINLFPGDGLGFDESPESKVMDGINHMDYTVEMVNEQGRNLGEEFGRVLSKRYTIFYHDIVQRILAQRPDKTLMTGAYSAYQYAPLEVNDPSSVSEYKMDDSAMLLITHSWEHNHPIPIKEGSTAPNYYFDESMGGWKKIYSNFGVYEYYWKMAMNELPFPIIHSIRHDLPYYYTNDFSFLYTQYSLDNIGTYGLNYYIAAKLAWNVNADVDKLLADFYSKFFGSAGPHMKKYFEKLEGAAIRSDLELSPKYYGAFLDLFTDDVLEDCTRHLENAKKAAQDSELLLKRIELSEVSLHYTKKVIMYLKEIKRVLDIDNKLLYRTFLDEELANTKKKSEEIEEIITQLGAYKTIQQTTYTQALLNIGNAINGVRGYFYGDDYTKGEWLGVNRLSAEKGYGNHELFDIWIYANDIDYDTGPEHQINIINRLGDSIELERIARESSEAGNGKDKGFLLSGFSFRDIIGSDDSITIEVFNFPGGPSHSTFYAIAIMPHMEQISQDDVTWRYQNDTNFIRKESLGFIEFCEGNRDDERFTVTIELYTHK